MEPTPSNQADNCVGKRTQRYLSDDSAHGFLVMGATTGSPTVITILRILIILAIGLRYNSGIRRKTPNFEGRDEITRKRYGLIPGRGRPVFYADSPLSGFPLLRSGSRTPCPWP